MPQTHLMGWSFISSVQVWAITPLCRFMIFSKKDFWIKLVFTLLLILADITVLPMRHFSSRARVMVVPSFDHPWRHQRSCESCDHHYDAQLIYRIQKSLLPRKKAFLIATAHVVKDAVAEVLGKQWVIICIFACVAFCAGAHGCQAN